MKSILHSWGVARWLLLLGCLSVLVGQPGRGHAQFFPEPTYGPYLAPQPWQASYSGYVASQGELRQDGQRIAIEYDPSGEEIATIQLEPGTEIRSSAEWNAWVTLWQQAIADREAGGGLYQELEREQFEQSSRQCLDESAQPVAVTSQFELAPEVRSVLVASVAEGLPACSGYILATVPLALPLQVRADDTSLLVDGQWNVLGTSQIGGAFGYRAAYFDAEQSGCPEDAALPASVRNLVAFQRCPTGSIPSVYAPVSGAVIETVSQSGEIAAQTGLDGRYQLPYWYYADDPDGSLWIGRQVTAKVTFSRIEPRLPSSRFFYLRRLGSGRTLHFPIDTVTLRAQARLGNPTKSSEGEAAAGVSQFAAVGVVDIDYLFEDEFTQYAVDPPGSAESDKDQGLVKEISAQDLRETDIYLFRAADDKLVGERRGMSPLELSGIAASSQFPNASVPPRCEGLACLSFVVVTRGPAFVDLDNEGTVGSDGILAPFASDPPSGAIGIEAEYPQSPNAVFLRPGDLVKVVAINRSTGYTGMALGRVYVDSAAAARAASEGAGVLNEQYTVQSDGLSVIADPENAAKDLRIDMYPPNLRVQVDREYDVQFGATAGEERNYIVGFEGSALNTDKIITVRTEWFAQDGSPLPAGLPGLTGRLARVRSGVLEEVGVEDASGTNVGEFPIQPGVQVSVARLPEDQVDREHLYLHVDGSPSVGTNDFAGRAGLSRPDFSVGEVCYYSTNNAKACFEKQANEPALQSRPGQFVPFRVPIYDKEFSEAQRAAFLEQDLEDPGPVYRWPYRPEMQFTVHDLQVEDVYRVEEDGTEVSVVGDSVPSFFDDTAFSAGVDYTITGPFDPPLSPFGPPVGDIDGDAEPDTRAFSWEVGGTTLNTVLPNTSDSTSIRIENYLEDVDDELEAEDYLALRLLQLGDEANVLWEFAALDFTIDPNTDIDVPIGPRLTPAPYDPDDVGAETVLVVRVFSGGKPVDDGTVVSWRLELNEHSGVLPGTSVTEDGYASVKLIMDPTPGNRYRVEARLQTLIVGGEVQSIDASVRTGLIEVVAGEPKSIALTAAGTVLTAGSADQEVLTALVKDKFGNPVSDGTSVSFFAEGAGEVVLLGTGETEDGVAQAEVSPGLEEGALAVEVRAGSVSVEQLYTVQAAQGNLVASSAELDALHDEAATLTATFMGEDGAPVG